jgi:hypothetical protein
MKKKKNSKEIPEISTENCIEGKFGVHLKQLLYYFRFAQPVGTRNGLTVQCPYKNPSETLYTISHAASHLDQLHEIPNITLHHEPRSQPPGPVT